MRPRYEEREEREREEEYRPRHAHRPPDGGSRRDHVVISTVIVGVILFLVIGTPYLKRRLATDGSFVNSIGGDADREAVRHWLRDNADDPQFREIRWWPPRPLSATDDHRDAYADRRDGDRRDGDRRDSDRRDSDRRDSDRRDDNRSGDRVCRMQYRERTANGDDVTRDDYFAVRDGRAHLLSRNSSLAVAARRAFADNDGLP
jgi:hypothetical protein